jgi:hypothetical protein
LPDGEKITTEITKKQREILDALHMRVSKNLFMEKYIYY